MHSYIHTHTLTNYAPDCMERMGLSLHTYIHTYIMNTHMYTYIYIYIQICTLLIAWRAWGNMLDATPSGISQSGQMVDLNTNMNSTSTGHKTQVDLPAIAQVCVYVFVCLCVCVCVCAPEYLLQLNIERKSHVISLSHSSGRIQIYTPTHTYTHTYIHTYRSSS